MPAAHRNAFGQLIVEPEALPREERIRCLRRLAGELQAAQSHEARWLGRVLSAWLAEGGSLEQHLAVTAPRGSHSTAKHITSRTARDALLLKLANIVGGDIRAARVLQGVEAAPASVSELVEMLHALGAPRTSRAISRARSTTRHHR